MKWIKFVIVMTVMCAVFGKDTDEEELSQENERDNREIDREGWRAVETFQDGNFAWIPHEQPQVQSEEQVPKRRRLKKRKRRPPMFSLTEEFNSDETLPDRTFSLRRRIRPQRLEQIREPWEEMNEEVIRKPNIRRRVTPTYQPSEEEIIISGEEQINISPTGVTIRFEEELPDMREEHLKSTEETIQVFYDKHKNRNEGPVLQIPAVTDLKSVLKQNGGGMSLSEILQQKNLSLTELLMGDQRAIFALTEKPQDITESAVNIKTTEFETESTKYKRLPPSVGLKKHTNRNYEQRGDSLETLSTKDTLEAQQNRLALLHGHKDNTLFSSVTKYDVVTEPTTDRRIFVPSHPKYYTSLNYMPDFNLYSQPTTEPLPQPTVMEEITTTSTTTSKPVATTKIINLKPKLKNLPITNAKINKVIPRTIFKLEEKEEENYPIAKPLKIKLDEVFGFKAEENKNVTEKRADKRDGPLRVSIDLESLLEKTTKKVEPENESYQTTTNLKVKEPVTTTEPLAEKVTYVTAKEEIMEILQDPISRQKLSRILENRNMTVQELVEQRERGSSQLHLADIFHNKTREPEPKEEPHVGHIDAKYFNSFPIFGRKQKSRIFDEQHSTTLNTKQTKNITKITEMTSEITTVKYEEAYLITSFPTVKIEANKDLKEKTNTLIWKELYPDLFGDVHDNSKKLDEKLVDPFQFSRESSEEDIQRLEDIDSTLALSSNEKLNVHDENSFEEVLINIPSGVKSAVFVSLAIIGLSIIVFSTILLLFKWTQRQKRIHNYCNSLSSKIKSPIIMQRRPVTTIKSLMNETLGRKKNYYKSNVQSMSDDMWEHSGDRRPSF